jgi:uncharacterized protein YneR
MQKIIFDEKINEKTLFKSEYLLTKQQNLQLFAKYGSDAFQQQNESLEQILNK